MRAGARHRLGWLSERGMGASVLVATLSAAFAVVLVSTTGYLAAVLRADDEIGASQVLGVVLAVVSVILVGVAMYVAAVVTANTFATVVAGQTRRIALLRLLGATAASQRRTMAARGLVLGAIGGGLGLAAGLGLSAGGIALAGRFLDLEQVSYNLVAPVLGVPVLVVVLTTWAAAFVGSRRILTVTPLQAVAAAVEASREESLARPVRNGVAVVAFGIGIALLALGVLLGLVSPLGVVVAFSGGVFSFTGLVLGSALVMPPLLRLVGRALGDSVPARLARENATRYPERSSRMTIGVVIGVTLVTMFAVAGSSAEAVLTVAAGGTLPVQLSAALRAFTAIMMGLVAVSAVIAAVGLVNLLTIGVVQRRRELGLLRALGLSGGQIRRLVLFEAAHVTVTATGFGLLLGIGYGWAAAQSLLGSVRLNPAAPGPHLIWPDVPLVPMLVVVAATVVLTLVASLAPTRLATRISPVEALADVG